MSESQDQCHGVKLLIGSHLNLDSLFLYLDDYLEIKPAQDEYLMHFNSFWISDEMQIHTL